MKLNDLSSDVLMNITSRPDLVFVRGEGAWLWDHQGKQYLDFIQGWAVNCLGHCPKVIQEALVRQAAKLICPSPAFYNEPSIRLAQKITAGSVFDRVFFTNCGAEANEGAIKLARRWGQKRKNGATDFITFHNSFHGRTLATMSASGKPQFKPLFEPKVPGFTHVPLNDLAAVEQAMTDRTAAVMIEPVQGEAGVIPAETGFLLELRELTRRRNVLLIVDEVQTGYGRLGKMWGYEVAGIEPDIMTLGKGIGGGVPLAALCATEAVSVFEPGDQGGTYNGNPLMTEVGCAVFDAVSEPAFLANVEEMGAYLTESLAGLSKRLGLGEVRGQGLLIALDLGSDIGASVVDRARDAGLLVNSPRPASLRFMPALNVTRAEIDRMVELLEPAIRAERDSARAA
jgi:acetylornithine/N-succinyldiaminopimelate aminotransferase